MELSQRPVVPHAPFLIYRIQGARAGGSPERLGTKAVPGNLRRRDPDTGLGRRNSRQRRQAARYWNATVETPSLGDSPTPPLAFGRRTCVPRHMFQQPLGGSRIISLSPRWFGPCVADASGSRRHSEPSPSRLQGDTGARRRRLGSAQGRSGNVRRTGPSLCTGATPIPAGQGGEAGHLTALLLLLSVPSPTQLGRSQLANRAP